MGLEYAAQPQIQTTRRQAKEGCCRKFKIPALLRLYIIAGAYFQTELFLHAFERQSVGITQEGGGEGRIGIERDREDAAVSCGGRRIRATPTTTETVEPDQEITNSAGQERDGNTAKRTTATCIHPRDEATCRIGEGPAQTRSGGNLQRDRRHQATVGPPQRGKAAARGDGRGCRRALHASGRGEDPATTTSRASTQGPRGYATASCIYEAANGSPHAAIPGRSRPHQALGTDPHIATAGGQDTQEAHGGERTGQEHAERCQSTIWTQGAEQDSQRCSFSLWPLKGSGGRNGLILDYMDCSQLPMSGKTACFTRTWGSLQLRACCLPTTL